MELRHYKDFFTVPATYRANMTREAINATPDTWMDFYPHVTFINLLNTLFDEARPVWITGNFGTGKSNAALVIQKLFMDDMSRVDKWFQDNQNVITNGDALRTKLFEEREAGTLVVYDYNASGIGPNAEFLVRLEKGVFSALEEYGFIIPVKKANLELVIDRLYREGENFFKTRDSMQSEMKSLRSEIHSMEQLVALLHEESAIESAAENTAKTPTHYLEDVQAVFRKDDIYLNIDVPTFRAWIQDVLEANHLKRIIYIFDEFSEFIDANSAQLKTFEDVTEVPDVNHFYLVPVTHKEPKAFLGENAPGAKRAKDRFYFRNLEMPNDIAFRLAAHAMKPVKNDEIAHEWKNEKDKLWNSVRTVIDRFTDPPTSAAYVAHQSFYDILPIHPMTAFLLKFLSEHARSNQRSIFEYLKGSAEGREFQEFITIGSPSIAHAQFLTPDYLWKYFMERSDAGQSREITEIKLEYERIVTREYRNYPDTHEEIRVLKTVLLFSLLSRLAPGGHERLVPTVENVELSFRGDGTVMDVRRILKDMSENKHCFSIVDGSIDLYSSTVGGDELQKKMTEFDGQFHDLLSPFCQKAFEDHTKSARGGFSAERFDIRVSDIGHTTRINIQSATREKYSEGLAKDTASVCLWFVVAKDRTEQLQVREKSESLLTNLRDHRIIMFSFPDNTFCKENTNLWNEFVSLYAKYMLENNTAARDQIKQNYESIANKWTATLRESGTAIDMRYYDTVKDCIVCERYSWSQMKSFLHSYIERTLDACPDTLTEQITVYGNKALKQWALAGIRFTGTAQMGQFVNSLKAKGVSVSDEWFASHPEHVFSKIRSLLEKKYSNTVGKGTVLSLRKVYIELQRAPYGLRYNCLSAFTLGFCSAWMLQKNCQWTNNQLTRPLDDETLAEIIEATVSDKKATEKFICRLSKEDKAFARHASQMFGLAPFEDSTPLKTLEAVSAEVEITSMKVPLWVLADYIRTTDPENEKAASVLDKLCTALRISSKGNSDEKTNAITEIGEMILGDSTLIDTISGYTKCATYLLAFRNYVDRADPELRILAERIEDQSYQYCDMILNDAAPTSGWLWNQSDITSLIEKAHGKYQFISSVRDLLHLTGYAPYDDILRRLIDRIDESGLPYAIIGEKYPVISRLITELNGNRDVFLLLNTLENCKELLSLLCNDPQKKTVMMIVRERTGDLKIEDNDLANILAEIATSSNYSVNMSTDAYIKLIHKAVEMNVRNLLVRKVTQEWCRISRMTSVSEWHSETKLPVWAVFAKMDDRDDFVRLILTPNMFATDMLAQKLSLLETMPEIDIADCQNAFMSKMIPVGYRKLGIKLSSLLKYLETKFGTNPDRWPMQPDIMDFIREQYQAELAPNVVSKLKSSNADTLKERILELAKTDPDIGLKFFEL